ncbi:hypothetical protein ACKKBG_A04095 [Auxenochlorella protothecoides x Auxenochlorella symbiontica]
MTDGTEASLHPKRVAALPASAAPPPAKKKKRQATSPDLIRREILDVYSAYDALLSSPTDPEPYVQTLVSAGATGSAPARRLAARLLPRFASLCPRLCLPASSALLELAALSLGAGEEALAADARRDAGAGLPLVVPAMLRAGAAGPAATRAAIGLIDAAFRRLARPPIPGAEAEAWVEALVVAFRARPRLVLAACLPALRAEGGGSRAVAASLIRDRLLAGGVAAEVLAQLPLGEALWFDSQLEGALPGLPPECASLVRQLAVKVPGSAAQAAEEARLAEGAGGDILADGPQDGHRAPAPASCNGNGGPSNPPLPGDSGAAPAAPLPPTAHVFPPGAGTPASPLPPLPAAMVMGGPPGDLPPAAPPLPPGDHPECIAPPVHAPRNPAAPLASVAPRSASQGQLSPEGRHACSGRRRDCEEDPSSGPGPSDGHRRRDGPPAWRGAAVVRPPSPPRQPRPSGRLRAPFAARGPPSRRSPSPPIPRRGRARPSGVRDGASGSPRRPPRRSPSPEGPRLAGPLLRFSRLPPDLPPRAVRAEAARHARAGRVAPAGPGAVLVCFPSMHEAAACFEAMAGRPVWGPAPLRLDWALPPAAAEEGAGPDRAAHVWVPGVAGPAQEGAVLAGLRRAGPGAAAAPVMRVLGARPGLLLGGGGLKTAEEVLRALRGGEPGPELNGASREAVRDPAAAARAQGPSRSSSEEAGELRP